MYRIYIGFAVSLVFSPPHVDAPSFSNIPPSQSGGGEIKCGFSLGNSLREKPASNFLPFALNPFSQYESMVCMDKLLAIVALQSARMSLSRGPGMKSRRELFEMGTEMIWELHFKMEQSWRIWRPKFNNQLERAHLRTNRSNRRVASAEVAVATPSAEVSVATPRSGQNLSGPKMIRQSACLRGGGGGTRQSAK